MAWSKAGGGRPPGMAQPSKVSNEESREEAERRAKMTRHRSCQVLVLALLIWVSGNAFAQKKAFLVLDVYGKAVTAAERDPLAPIEQDLAKSRDPEITTGFSHLITETFPFEARAASLRSA
jgi:hypothetical protein